MMDITRLNLAEVLAPSGHPRAGEVVPVYGFVIKYERGIVVVDTGVGSGNSAIEHLYRPVRRPLVDALADFNIRPSDVTVVINSHLHFDHCGENNLFPDRPIFVQAREYDDARGSLYTVVDWVDFRGANYELLDGEKEILPGITVIPTPGHTAGHQSVLVETQNGRTIIAGQAAETANEFARAQPDGNGVGAAGDEDPHLPSLRRLHDLVPRRVPFAHDATVWRAER